MAEKYDQPPGSVRIEIEGGGAPAGVLTAQLDLSAFDQVSAGQTAPAPTPTPHAAQPAAQGLEGFDQATAVSAPASVTNPYAVEDWKAMSPEQARERLQAIPAYDAEKRQAYDTLPWYEKLTTATPPGMHPSVREETVQHLQDIAVRDQEPEAGAMEPHWLLDPPQMLANMYPQTALMGLGVASKKIGQVVKGGTEVLAESAPGRAASAWLKPYGDAASAISAAIAETPAGQAVSRYGQSVGRFVSDLHGRFMPTFLRPQAKEASYPIRHYASEQRLQGLRNQQQLMDGMAQAEAKLREMEQAWHDAWVAKYGSEPDVTSFSPRPSQGFKPPPGTPPPVSPLWEGSFKYGYIPEPEIPVAEQASWFEYAMSQGYRPPMGGPNAYPSLMRNRAELRALEHLMGDNPTAAQLGREQGLKLAITQQEKYLAEAAYQYMMHRRPLDPRLQDYIPAAHKPLPFEVQDTDPILNPPAARAKRGQWMYPKVPEGASTGATEPLWLTRQDAEQAFTLAQQQGFTASRDLQETLLTHQETMDKVWQELSAEGGPDFGVDQRFMTLLREEDRLTREVGQEALTWLIEHDLQGTPADLVNQHPWGRRMQGEVLQSHQPGFRGPPKPSQWNAQLHFYDSMEHGLGKYSPQLEAQLQEKLTQAYGELRGLPREVQEDFLWNYWPRFWKDKGEAERVLEGVVENTHIPTSYKDRLMTSNVEAMQNGLAPRASNPVQHVLGELNVLDIFLMQHKALKAQEQLGLVRRLSPGETVPEGWVPLPESVGRALTYEPGKVSVQAAGAGVVETQPWYAPEEVARVWKNWTSKGLGEQDWYQFVRQRSNALIMFRLGLSGFHAMAESLYAMTSDIALGLMQLSEGRVAPGLGSIGRGVTPYSVVQTFREGRGLIKEAMFPGSMPPELAEMVAHLTRGGMDFQRGAYYRTAPTAAGNMWRQMQAHPFLATIEKISEPLMGKFVPAVKLGAAARLAEEELRRLGPGATEQQIRAAMARVVDSVDNRFGLLAYDNLFWYHTLKDLSHLMVQSVGWNLGSLREASGGVFDLGKALSGTDPVLSSRTAFVASLPFLTGLYGAMLQYLMTGERPQELKDYYFPKTGRRLNQYAERLKLPTYMYDTTHIIHSLQTKSDLIGWGMGKLNPLLTTGYELLHNQDFFGLPIRGEHGSKPAEVVEKMLERFPEEAREPLRQFYQSLVFAAESYIPYSGSQVARGMRHDDPMLTIGGALGLTPAPSWLMESPGQRSQREWQEGRRIDRQRQRLENR